MKKFASIVLSLVMVISLTAGVDFSAYADSTSGGLTYKVLGTGDSVIITGAANKNISSIDIPSTLYDDELGKELVVGAIAQTAFRDYRSLSEITLPNTLTSIGLNAFDGTAFYNRLNNWQDGYLYCSNYLLDVDDSKTTATVKADTLDVANNVTSHSLEYIGILGMATRVNCPISKNVVIGCYPDSVAEMRAYELGLKYYDLSECSHSEQVSHRVEPTCMKEGANEIRCVRCDKLIKSEPIKKISHTMVIIKKGHPATVSEDGWTEEGYCSVCGYEEKSEFVERTGHDYKIVKMVPANCYEGEKIYSVCQICGHEQCEYTESGPMGHDFVVCNDRATFGVEGNYRYRCSDCGMYTPNTIIPAIAKVSLSTEVYTYNGNNKRPMVKTKDSKRNQIDSQYYNTTYPKESKKVGEYSVKVEFTGKYYGKKTLTYVINPKNTSIKSLKAGKKSFTINIKKYTTQTTGYQIQYSTDKNFKNAKTSSVSNKTTSKTVKSLKSKKKYYVRLRTYKTVNGKKFYSKWSDAKTVKTK